MSNEMKNEIFKSFVYGMTIKEIAEIYEVEESVLENLLKENANEIAELRAYRTALEG